MPVAFAPFNLDIAFIGSDGGVVRTSGSFVDASAGCSGRGLTDGDLTDCRSGSARFPRGSTASTGNLATLQFQSVTLNPLDPFNHGDRRYAGQRHLGIQREGWRSWFESGGRDGGQSG